MGFLILPGYRTAPQRHTQLFISKMGIYVTLQKDQEILHLGLIQYLTRLEHALEAVHTIK